MKLWPFGKRTKSERKEPSVIPFPADIEEIPSMKHHGLRALCGALMDRHSSCLSPHPFCGPQGHRQEGDTLIQVIAHAIPQSYPDGRSLLAIYLCRAKSGISSTNTGLVDPLDYAVRLTYLDTTPSWKMLVDLMEDGNYIVRFGSITNPVEGDFSTGRVDEESMRTLHSIPEPAHAKWEYWESVITEGQRVIPEFHCLQVKGEWWIVDADRERGMYCQMAALEFADNPEHNWGIYKPDRSGYYFNPNDGSEYSKMLYENLPLIR